MRWILILLLFTVKPSHYKYLPQCKRGMATAPASDKYSSPSLLQRIFSGSNYRKEWETPVIIPVLDLQSTNLRIVRMGGGQQTTSLELVDEAGREWALRSVDKNVQLPGKFINNIFIEAVVQDHVSGSYPYAGLSIPTLARAAGIPVGDQHLYFVPDDSAFGEFRSLMAGKVFILVNNQTRIQKGITTEEMLGKLKWDKEYFVDEKAYLKARLVDWLVADWDRHDGQWRWVEDKTDSGMAFHIVPRDRDQAFYRSNGLLAKLIGLFFLPHIDKFNSTGRGIKGLSQKTIRFDKQFTSQLQKNDWEKIITEFQTNITDSLIESAIRRQPREIFAIRGNKLIEKLKSRRDGLLKHVMRYYSFLNDHK